MLGTLGNGETVRLEVPTTVPCGLTEYCQRYGGTCYAQVHTKQGAGLWVPVERRLIYAHYEYLLFHTEDGGSVFRGNVMMRGECSSKREAAPWPLRGRAV